MQIGSNNIRAHVGDFIFTSKLVDGRFLTIAAYYRKTRISTDAGCDILKQAFARAAILSNENSAACAFTSVKIS